MVDQEKAYIYRFGFPIFEAFEFVHDILNSIPKTNVPMCCRIQDVVILTAIESDMWLSTNT